MVNLALPPDTKDHIKLADWLELKAILAHDRNASFGDLSSALRLSGTYDFSELDADDAFFYDKDEFIEEMAGNIFREFQRREQSASKSYPFDIKNGYLQCKTDNPVDDFPSYIFCLCLSFLRMNFNQPPYPRRLFEELSLLAAQLYMGGESLKFGFPRQNKQGFADAINDLCHRIGEGFGFKPSNSSGSTKATLYSKDDKLDIIVWKPFPDKKKSKLVLFGQCASHQMWSDIRDKVVELNPEAFCKQWMREQPIVPIIKSFFTPNCFEDDQWDYLARHGGVLFDRCRIAYWAHNDTSLDYSDYINAIKFMFISLI